MSRARLVAVMVAALTALTTIHAPAAAGDGLPILGVDAGRTGVTDGAGSRYVTMSARRDTVVARVAVADGRVQASRALPGRFTIPAVAYDGSASGISADGETLALIRPRISFPQRQTRIAVLEAERLRLDRIVSLRGDFSFDAISPDGETMYLIRYLAPRDLTRYEVRAFDLGSGRLLPGAIVDPDEPDEEMSGLPMSRATSPNGRWAYTLYDGVKHEPFIHALDTVGRTAVCIDLPQLEGHRDLFQLGLVSGPGGSLTVADRGRPLLAVDTETFEVTRAAEPRSGEDGSDDGAPSAVVVAIVLAGLALLAGALGAVWTRGRRGTRRAMPAEAEMPADPELELISRE